MSTLTETVAAKHLRRAALAQRRWSSVTFYTGLGILGVLVLREQEFILAARGLGYSTPRIVFRHALPSLLRSNLVYSAADLVLNLLFLASLSYLGLGVQPPK